MRIFVGFRPVEMSPERIPVVRRPVVLSIFAVGAFALVASACATTGPIGGTTTTDAEATLTTIAHQDTVGAAATTTPSSVPPEIQMTDIDLPQIGDALTRWWSLTPPIPYGEAMDMISRTGFGDGEDWAAVEGCVVDSRSSLWVMEAARSRFVEFGSDGDFVQEIVIPPEHLVQGKFFHYRDLVATNNGTLVTMRQTASGVTLLLHDQDGFEERDFEGFWQFAGAVGNTVFLWGDPGAELVAFDVESRTFLEDAAALRGYSQTVDGDRLRVSRHPSLDQVVLTFAGHGDSSLALDWSATSHPGSTDELWLQVRATSEDGSDLGAVIRLEADGAISTVAPLPFLDGKESLRSATDIFIDGVTGRPSLCVVGEEGLVLASLR